MENAEKMGQVEVITRSKTFVDLCDITVKKRECDPLDSYGKFNVSFVVWERHDWERLTACILPGENNS